MIRRPDCPDIAMLGEVSRGRPVTIFGPAHNFVDGVNPGRWHLLPRDGSTGVRERCHVQQHGHLAASLPRQRERVADEAVGKPPPVRRVGNDVPGAGYALFQEIDASFAITVIVQVG